MAGKKKKGPGPEARGKPTETAPAASASSSPPSAAPAGGTGGGAPPSRRRFLKLAGAGALAAGAVGVWYARERSGGHEGHAAHDAGAPDAAAPVGPVARPEQLASFDPHEYDTLDAIAGVLIPADEQDPGARETGAAIYIDRAMANPAFEVGKRGLKVGVKAFDWQSQQAYAKKFVELGFAEQEAVVQAVYQGEADRGRFKGRTFLTLMMSLTLEGHLSEPVHGGNRDGIGWKLVAFEPVDPRPGHPGMGSMHMGHGAAPSPGATPAKARPARH